MGARCHLWIRSSDLDWKKTLQVASSSLHAYEVLHLASYDSVSIQHDLGEGALGKFGERVRMEDFGGAGM